jgi:wyosine [tRNA(Phe)-imidazoG37] synthetase (radical SAM superfamily)
LFEEEEKEIVFEEKDSKDIDPEEEIFDEVKTTRSGRVSRLVHKYVTMHHAHLQTQAIDPQEYNIDTAKVIAQMINKMNIQFVQTYSLAKGIKAFGAEEHQAAHEEMKQLHNHVVFIPLLVEELTQIEKRRAMESLIFLTEKKDGRIKARTCANRST